MFLLIYAVLLTPFYNPRTQKWSDHFVLRDGKIIPLTAEGRVTEQIFQFNNSDRMLERLKLIASNDYPPKL